MLGNLKASDKAHLVGVVDPDALTAAAHSTGWVKASDYQQFLAIIAVGTLGASATVNAKIEQATDGSGTGVKDVTGKAITELTQAGSDSDKQAMINFTPEDLDRDNDFDYVRLTVTVGVATSDGGAVLLGFESRYGGAHDATVDEVV